MNQELEEHLELGGKTSANEDWYYRKQIKKMLLDFYLDSVKQDFSEKSTVYDVTKFIEFWIEKHFPFNFGIKDETPQ